MSEWWAANWFNVAGLLVGLLGIPGFWIGWKSWKRKKPVYLIESNNIFSDIGISVPSVSVSFAGFGEPIKALTITKIALWNAGNDTINKQDMVKLDPLCIKATGGAIVLSAEIIATSCELNQFALSTNREKDTVTIGFDYFDEMQGVVVQIFHTGDSSDSLKVTGTFKSVKSIDRRLGRLDAARKRRQKNQPPFPIVWQGVFFATFLVLAILINVAPLKEPPPAITQEEYDKLRDENIKLMRSLPLILPGLALYMAVTLSLTIYYFYYSNRPPRSLSKFESH